MGISIYPPISKSTPNTLCRSLTFARIERIPFRLFTIFLDVLYERRGNFLIRVSQLISEHVREILQGEKTGVRYTFETIDRECLRQEPLDSPQSIRFCELE